MKIKRQEKILELINTHTVTTQEELQTLLGLAGFGATQATISRDIRELRLMKVLSQEGIYHYVAAPKKEHEPIPMNINSVFLESIKTVDHAGDFVVVKCFPGMANAVCAAVDNGSWDGLVGTIAGDDTIFLLLRTPQNAEEFAGFLQDTVAKAREAKGVKNS